MYFVLVGLIEAIIGLIKCILSTTVKLCFIKYIYYSTIYFLHNTLRVKVRA